MSSCPKTASAIPTAPSRHGPSGFKHGKPSPAGRITFTTWRLWKKTDSLLDSGLLGPVTLSAAEMFEL